MIGRDNAARDITSETVIERLEEAGRTMLAMPNCGYRLTMKTQHFGAVREETTSTKLNSNPRIRPPAPDAQCISRMDEAYAWLSYIPQDRYVLRRIVGARSLVNPITDKHIHSWRGIASMLKCDPKAIQGWFFDGIWIIVAGLHARETS